MYQLRYLNGDGKEMLKRERQWTRQGAMQLAEYARDYWNLTTQIYRWGRLRTTVHKDHVTVHHR